MSSAEQTTSQKRRKDLIENAGKWIGSADSKATALLGMNGTVLALVGTGFVFAEKTTSGGQISTLAVALFGLSVIMSILFAAFTIHPRLDRQAILQKGNFHEPKAKGEPTQSPTYFYELGALKKGQFTNRIDQSDDVYEKDLEEQAFIACRVAHEKMCTLRIAVWALVVGLLALAVAILVAVGSFYFYKAPPPQAGQEMTTT